jgi:hypothetical protein
VPTGCAAWPGLFRLGKPARAAELETRRDSLDLSDRCGCRVFCRLSGSELEERRYTEPGDS